MLNVHTIFDDIDNLLKEICEFLSENIEDGNISEKHKELAKTLVDRSKKQLQNIARVTTTLSKPETEEDESYVDMTPAKETAVEEPLPKVQLRRPYIQITEDRTCPYLSQGIHEIKDIEKAGYLEKKGKLWFLDHLIKLFIVIKDSWLLIYSNDSDKKPTEVVDLKKSMVKHVEYFKDGGNQRDGRSFLIITDTKTLQFTGKNTKDMEQWVSIISKSSQYEVEDDSTQTQKVETNAPIKFMGKFSRKELPPEPVPGVQNSYMPRRSNNNSTNSDPMDTYDPVHIPDSPSGNEAIDENIYECPQLITPTINGKSKRNFQFESSKPEEAPPPPLPPFPSTLRRDKSPQPRTQPPAAPNPPPVIRSKLKLSKESIHDLRETITSTRSSFSDDEDVEYDVPLNEKEELQSLASVPNVDKEGYIKKPLSFPIVQTNQDDEDETYDVIVHPENEVKKFVPFAGLKQSTSPKIAKVPPPRAPKPAVPLRKSNITQRTAF